MTNQQIIDAAPEEPTPEVETIEFGSEYYEYMANLPETRAELVFFIHSSYTAIDSDGNYVKWENIPVSEREAAMQLPAPPQKPTRIAW